MLEERGEDPRARRFLRARKKKQKRLEEGLSGGVPYASLDVESNP